MKFIPLVLLFALVVVACTPNATPTSNTTQNTVVCSQEYNPVCGTDGKTYSNACTATEQNKVTIDYTGECKKIIQSYDVLVTVRDGQPVEISDMQIPVNHETTFKFVNQRTTKARILIPQLDIAQDIEAGADAYVTTTPSKTGYYAVQLNGASAATIQITEN